MTIHQLFRSLSLQPEDMELLGSAYDIALKRLGLRDRNDPITTLVAKTVIEIYQSGVQDVAQLADRTVKRLAPRSPSG
jgi:hypothetical protein